MYDMNLISIVMSIVGSLLYYVFSSKKEESLSSLIDRIESVVSDNPCAISHPIIGPSEPLPDIRPEVQAKRIDNIVKSGACSACKSRDTTTIDGLCVYCACPKCQCYMDGPCSWCRPWFERLDRRRLETNNNADNGRDIRIVLARKWIINAIDRLDNGEAPELNAVLWDIIKKGNNNVS